jgi:hypothetical protein
MCNHRGFLHKRSERCRNEMGQNRKIRKSRNKNKLKVENRDFLDLSVSAPLEKIEPIIPRFPNYDFKIELERDAKNEKRLLWSEIIVLLGITAFVILRSYILSSF